MTSYIYMKVEELRALAKEKNMPGAWKAKKSEIIAFLESQEAPESTESHETIKLSGEGKTASELIQKHSNGWEKIAKKNIKNAYGWIVGENENAVQDGTMTLEEFMKWVQTEALDYIYHEAITTTYGSDYAGGPAPTEMRFAGKEFCYDYLKRLFLNDGYNIQEEQEAAHEAQNDPESTEAVEADKLQDEEKEASKPAVEPLKPNKGYGAWVVDRETKKITTVVAEAESREEFYESIKGKYRVRLITKPEKLEEECKQWEIRHAHNKKLKNEKYAADKIEAEKMSMSVIEYRKWLRASAKRGE